MRLKKPDGTWIERAKNVMAQTHTGTNSKRHTQYPANYPSHTNGMGSGPYLFDFLGNKYLDFVSGLGSVSLGYSNGHVIEAVQRQALKGCSHSLPSTLEVEVAEMVSAIIPSCQHLRFLKTGNEASLAAVRIARSFTGRSLIYNDGYHGHGDIFTSMTPPALGIGDSFNIKQLPEDLKQVDLSAAAIIVEAVKTDMTEVWQKRIQSIRDFCKEHGILFIIDEIVTGFRVPKWTISNLWSLDPDIILLGKGIANGYPLSIVGGRKEIMDAQEYFVSSTFSGDTIALAACKATIEQIQMRSLDDLMFYGKRLQDKLNALHPDIKFEGYGTRAMFNITNPTSALFAQEMCNAGIMFGKAHFFHFAHLEANIEEFVMNSANAVIRNINDGRVKIEGDVPRETFKR